MNKLRVDVFRTDEYGSEWNWECIVCEIHNWEKFRPIFDNEIEGFTVSCRCCKRKFVADLWIPAYVRLNLIH